MAVSINWPTKVITIPQSYLTLVSGSVYSLDTDALRLDLKALEDSEQGITYLDTHRHNTETELAGVTYARIFEIINGYTITFEDGAYAVTLTGSNNNIADVTNVNQVSVRSNNAAGMVVSGSGVTGADVTAISAAVWAVATRELTDGVAAAVGELAKLAKNKVITDPVGGTYTVYDDDDVTPLLSGDLWEDAAGTVPYDGTGAERRDRLQ